MNIKLEILCCGVLNKCRRTGQYVDQQNCDLVCELGRLPIRTDKTVRLLAAERTQVRIIIKSTALVRVSRIAMVTLPNTFFVAGHMTTWILLMRSVSPHHTDCHALDILVIADVNMSHGQTSVRLVRWVHYESTDARE